MNSSDSASVRLPAASAVTTTPDVREQNHWFTTEVQPHEPALRSYLRSRFPSVDPDDIIQESYLKLLKVRAWGTVDSAKSYVFVIARNTALALFRRAKFISDTPVNELPDWCIVDQSPDAAAIANTRQQFALAEEAMEHLPSRCREIMRLAAFERLPPREIAARLRIAEATVYVQLASGI